jgi:hypothetical protein
MAPTLDPRIAVVGDGGRLGALLQTDAVRDVILSGPIDIFEALDFDLFDRIPQIVVRDPAALNRPFRAYADLPPRADQWWPQPDMTPLAWAIQTNKAEGVRILRELGAEG